MFNTGKNQRAELLSIQTFDNKSIYFLDQNIRAFLYGNFGAPPTDFQTRRGYQQDGVLEVNLTLQPRPVNMMLWSAPGCDRQAYWNTRNSLHEFLRPNRNGPMILTLKQPGGNRRSLTVRAHPGLVFPPTPVDDNSWNVNEPIEFMAFDPLWFDPAQSVTTQVSTADTDLIFPITFITGSKIVFGVSGAVSKVTVTYVGTWESYPVITLTGPYTSATISNVTTAVSFTLNIPISAGEQRIINLAPGMQQISDASGNNKFAELGPNSNLVDFNIRPDPEVAGGINVIQSQFIGGTIGQSAMQLAYYNRFFAL